MGRRLRIRFGRYALPDWKIAGSNGAAQLLGIKPTTLSSRLKALGIERKR
jgi:transcriptional regulator with GAF, ATPase, and Fis domain